MSRERTVKIEGYDGCVVVRPMRNIEKFDLMQSLGMTTEKLTSLSKNKKVGADDIDLNLSTIKGLFETAKDLIVSVDLKKGEDHYKSWDDLDYDPSGLPIQMEIVNFAIGMGK